MPLPTSVDPTDPRQAEERKPVTISRLHEFAREAGYFELTIEQQLQAVARQVVDNAIKEARGYLDAAIEERIGRIPKTAVQATELRTAALERLAKLIAGPDPNVALAAIRAALELERRPE